MEITKNQQEEEIHFYFPLSTTVESRFSDSLKAVFSQLLGYQYSELTVVGKTVESYRMALESEIGRWSGFAKVLRRSDRESFDVLRMYSMPFIRVGFDNEVLMVF